MTVIRKAATAEVDGLDFVLSDETRDRAGDVIMAAGWDLRSFRRNPVALFGHDSGFPIGRWEDVRVEGGKLKGRLAFAKEGTSARIDELRRLVEQGILRAVSVGFRPLEDEPLDPAKPYAGRRFKRQELLETSLVSVPANPSALAVAKGLRISADTMSIAFGEHAGGGDGAAARGSAGEHAGNSTAPARIKTMTPLSKRIEDAQADLLQVRDALTAHIAEADADPIVTEELSSRIEQKQTALDALKRAEAALAAKSAPIGAPAAIRKPLGATDEVKSGDLLIRSALCHFVSRVSGKSIDKVLDERYPGHEATAVVTKADATVATTTTSGWASQLVQSATAEFLELLTPFSIYPGLSGRGVKVTFNNNQGSITIPSSSTDAALAGGFVLEGDPIPVGRMTLASITMTPHKFGIITTMTKEAAAYTTPALESVLRRSILRRTAITLDGLLLDATAGSTTRPAGLLNGVSAVSTGYGGGDYQAVIEDINALMAPFDTANAGRSMVLIMNPAQARKLAMMPGPDGTFGWADRFMSQFTVLVSTSATANRLIAVDAEDFASATGDTPMFDVSEQATIHMSDTPLEIVSGTGPTTADPVRSMFQTNSIALRMVLPITWKMRRSGMVQWIDGTTW